MTDLLDIRGLTRADALAVPMRCPHCRHNGIFEAPVEGAEVDWGAIDRSEPGMAMQVPWSAGVRACPNVECRGLVFVLLQRGRLFESFPPEQIDFDATELPDRILTTLEEAVRCHGAGAFKASALMVRRLLEELCADRAVEGRDLKAKLEALSNTILVPNDLLEAAYELRILVNDAAHIEAKAYDEICSAEAEAAIELAKELLKAVYQYSALVRRLRDLKRARE